MNDLQMINKRRSVAAVVACAVASVLASAGAFATVTAPDTSAITDTITAYAAGAVTLVIAFLVAKWGIHALGLFRARG